MMKKKAQSPLVSHSIAIVLGIVLVTIVIVALNNVSRQYQEFVAEHEIKQVCISVKSAAERIYSPENYTLQDNATLGKARIKLPVMIARSRYQIIFFNNSARVSIPELKINQTCKIGFPARFSGSSDGGLSEIYWKRYVNGSDEFGMVAV